MLSTIQLPKGTSCLTHSTLRSFNVMLVGSSIQVVYETIAHNSRARKGAAINLRRRRRLRLAAAGAAPRVTVGRPVRVRARCLVNELEAVGLAQETGGAAGLVEVSVLPNDLPRMPIDKNHAMVPVVGCGDRSGRQLDRE
jgi:hypothetical protein